MSSKEEGNFWQDRKLINSIDDTGYEEEIDRLDEEAKAEPKARNSSDSQIRFLNYNVLCQRLATPVHKPYCPGLAVKWIVRSEKLLQEISSYEADILCLQEVEEFQDWWQPKLSELGYDSIFYQRTGERYDGVAIAYRRDLYQLSRMKELSFNDMATAVAETEPNLAARLRQDNIALFALLQPWEECVFPTAVCIASVQLVSNKDLDDIRMLQAKYLCRTVEVFNADFQVPIILSGSFNFTPGSDIYHTIQTGLPRPTPQPPRAPERPLAYDPTTSTISLQWEPPESLDAPITGYRIMQRVDGNTSLGFHKELDIDVKDFILLTNLNGGMQYEFIIAARNCYGIGPYSPPSMPIFTKRVLKSGEPLQLKFIPQEDDKNDKIFNVGTSGRTPRYEDGKDNKNTSPRKTWTKMRFSTAVATGTRDEKLAHSQAFRSAYSTYEYESEPEYTFSTEKYTGTIDYIFFSAHELKPVKLLSIPDIDSLHGHDAREPEEIPDTGAWSQHESIEIIAYLSVEYEKPERWDECLYRSMGGHGTVNAQYNRKYIGEWAPPPLQNPHARHHWLPNLQYPSDHIAQMCVFCCIEDNLATSWR